MQTLDDLDEPRQQLMRRAFGKLLDWKAPNLEKSVGPHDPEVFGRFEDYLSGKVEEALALLSGLTDEQVADLAAGSQSNKDRVLEEWREFVRSDVSALARREPPWYAGGFGHPDFAADFEHWCKMPHFSIPETLCLSIGVEPRHFDADWLVQLRKKSNQTKIWPSLVFLLLREEQLSRQFTTSIHPSRVDPWRFLDWCRKVDFEAHPEFVRLLEKYHASEPAPAGTEEVPRRADSREVDSVAQLFTAMAIQELGYNPNQSKGPIPKEIVHLAAELGLNISDDTVRKYLRRGARFISKDWKPKID